GQDGSAHGSAGRQAIVDQDDRASMHVKRRAATTIVQRTPVQFLLLLGRYGVDDCEGNLQEAHNVFVENTHSTGGDGAHGQFLVSGDSQFTYQKDIERCVQRLCHGKADRDTTTRQRQHQHVRTVAVHHQLRGQLLSCVNAIAIAHDLLLQLLLICECSLWLLRSACRGCKCCWN